MRKVLVVLVMLLTVGTLFASTFVKVEGKTETAQTASVTINLPLSSADGYTGVEVGFSTNAVDSVDTEVTSSNSSINLDIANDKGSLSDGLHAYWKLTTNNSVTVKMYLAEALNGAIDDNTDTINWQVTATEIEAEDKDVGSLSTEPADVYESDHAITLVSLTPVAGAPSKIQTVADSTPLTIQTASFAGKTVDDYSANIVLSVEVK
ncbi:MAG: hypothetical protein H9802_08580 [Candidatus Phocaeicola faecipullorum]|nr:hypothetical protein [Candidatus Phocaeicola faecipullorum]